jgi:hypothetical protein
VVEHLFCRLVFRRAFQAFASAFTSRSSRSEDCFNLKQILEGL